MGMRSCYEPVLAHTSSVTWCADLSCVLAASAGQGPQPVAGPQAGLWGPVCARDPPGIHDVTTHRRHCNVAPADGHPA
jgi:hypothetical protein